jgi:sulfur-carrier protein
LRIDVRFFTVLRELTGKKEETLNFPENEIVTVESILSELSSKYGTPFQNYVYDENSHKVKGFLQFFINGKSVTTLDGLDSELENCDVLAIVPPVGGG